MRSERGYSLVELLISLGLIGIITAISVPVFLESNTRNDVWTGSEELGATIRQARLRAISQNTTFRVAFNCPAAGQVRYLIVTGDPDVDDDENRCSDTLDGDSGILDMPDDVALSSGDATGLQVTGRGVFTAIGDGIPLSIGVTNGTFARTLTVSTTGQITFTDGMPEEEEEEDGPPPE